MFALPDEKVFMDSVHGYIHIPKCFVEHLIDTEMFQRLRNIDQTGMRVLYPNAKHDRFSHSLGVFHLGCKAVDALLENFSREDYWNIRSDNKKLIFWAKNKVLFLIACLLHDIGHTPFSHSLENAVLLNSGGSRNFTRELMNKLTQNEDWGEIIDKIEAAPHEKMGAMLILDKLEKAIENIFDDLIEAKYPSISADNILYAEHYSYNPVIDKDELQRDICFIARMILGLKYEGYEPEKQIRNCFIELLNGGNFDVDKLDYVVRDTQMSGISNTNVDIERLLNSVCIITKTKYVDEIYSWEPFVNRVITRLSGNHDSDIRINGHFRGDILLKNHAEVIIGAGSTFLSFLPIGDTKIRYIQGAEGAKFTIETKIIQNGNEVTWKSGIAPNETKTLPVENGMCFECSIRNAEIVEREFCFSVEDKNSVGAVRIQIKGYCNIRIKGEFTIKSAITCFKETTVEGRVKEAVLLGNSIKSAVPDTKTYNEFSVGFKKQAINVIANVLEARNYLYLWIYAHHKVTYYANFLIPVLAGQVLRQINSDISSMEKADSVGETLAIWPLNYTEIQYLDDSYLWTAIKNYYYRGLAKGTEWAGLCRELLGRKYKVSLYKSLAEFDLLFEAFTDEQKQEIQNYLGRHIKKDLPNILEEGEYLAGYLDEELLGKLKKHGNISNITNIVFVDTSYKSKIMDVDETFIEMGTKNIASIGEIPLLAGRVAESSNSNRYFYLYYDTLTTDAVARKTETVELKSAVKSYFRENLAPIKTG